MFQKGVEGFAKYKGDVGSIIYKLIGGFKIINGLSWIKTNKIFKK
jgi:IMP dehydrogenase